MLQGAENRQVIPWSTRRPKVFQGTDKVAFRDRREPITFVSGDIMSTVLKEAQLAASNHFEGSASSSAPSRLGRSATALQDFIMQDRSGGSGVSAESAITAWQNENLSSRPLFTR